VSKKNISIAEKAHHVLKKVWGYDTFRDPQLDIINSVCEQHDTLALLPTGGGKSICYQVPGLILPGKVVVISPLISLMLDQVRALEDKGVMAKAIHSGLNGNEIELIYENFVFGPLKFLYISPERIDTESFQTRFYMANVSLIAVDEAHCISQWGHDFRPSYLKVSILREIKPEVPILALTATATPSILRDIAEQLYLKEYQVFSKSFARENISFNVMTSESKIDEVKKILNRVKGSTIIYMRSRNGCVETAAQLSSAGISSTIYHAGLSFIERESNQKLWMNNRARVIVATNAFGMGIDKKDVRCVIHLDVVSGVEDYYQEAGRAGRDGEPSFAITIYNQKDIYSAQKISETSYPQEEVIKDVYDKICRYLRIAVGSGQGHRYFLDIVDFCQKMKVNALLLESVFRILEKQEYLTIEYFKQIPERVTALTKPSDARDTYKEDDPRGIVLNQLFRMYEGLWDEDPIEISSFKMSILLDMDKNTLIKYLYKLMDEGMIWYQGSESLPEITFLQNRPIDINFKLDQLKYANQKKEALKRLHYMIEYYVGKECRQSQLLKYFEEKSPPCGKCDICLGSFEVSYSVEEKRKVFTIISDMNKEFYIDQVIKMFPYNKRKRINQCILDFERDDLIMIENNGRIIRKI
jgi:ATP-dependent DNA helicase RecQ